MLTIEYHHQFLKTIAKIKDESRKQQVKKQIKKIIDKPTIGKPMRYARKNTREVYIGSFRLAYAYVKQEKTIIFLALYHKDKQ